MQTDTNMRHNEYTSRSSVTRNPQTPLPPRAEDALSILKDSANDWEGDGCPREKAHRLLTKSGDFGQADAVEKIDQLLLRGYLYAVDGQIVITPPVR